MKQPYFRKQEMLEDRHYVMLSDLMQIRDVNENEVIYSIDDQQRYFFMVIRGNVKLV